jgi:hypothetical protein
MNNIKTHFHWIDENGAIHQVALGFLPYVPRVGERLSLIARDEESNLWSIILKFQVDKIAYEMFGRLLPASKTWENDREGGGCQVVLDVTPVDDQTRSYVQMVSEPEATH